MSRFIRLFTHVYAMLLNLYPSQFRTEFADEMQLVFFNAMHDAAKQGRPKLAMVLLRELRDLPKEILREHWRQRGESSMETKPRISLRELLSTAIPFLLYLTITLVDGLRIPGATVFVLIFPGALVILLIAGLFKGLPRWSLPALGLLLAVLNLILFSMWSPLLEALGPTPPPFLRGIFGAGLPYIGIIALTLIVILAFASIKPFRPFFQRIREDWTLFPLALYGIMPMVMLMSFDDYQNDAPYQFGMGVILIIGLWLYLRSTQRGQKMLILGIGITLAMAIEAIGKWILIPSQTWIDLLQRYPVEQTIQGEVTSTVYTWFWAMVIVFLPALLGLLRTVRNQSQRDPL